MSRISIIVPVYKVEQYLRECLDSILNQTFTDWEALLIDDGSPDNSGVICDEYASKDDRFRVFHIQNGGVSSARNLGITNAHGDYVAFVDSDDMLKPNALEICMGVIEENNLDMLQFGFTRSLDELYEISTQYGEVQDAHEFFQTRHNVCVWGGVIRRNILATNNILFVEGMKFAEDQLFVLHSIRNSKRLMRIDDKLYYYRENINSATHNSKPEELVHSCNILIHEKRKNPEFALVLDDTILMFILSLLSLAKCRKDINDILAMLDKADIKHCYQTYKSGRVFFKLFKINKHLACAVFRTYLRIKSSKLR